MENKLHERAEALQNGFFANRDQELLAKLREEMQADKSREALSAVIGIEDKKVLDGLLAHDIEPETLLAVGLIPMVVAAWSDGVLESAERKAIEKAADEAGVKEGSASYKLLSSWLATKPGDELMDAWKDYIVALAGELEKTEFDQIRERVVGRVEAVAAAAGGFLGMGSRVSDSEQKVIDELKATFSKAAI